jgi:2-polyprenyl-6-methoxyphenol hydroxylase-like FAD-dependent oxidoreductase
VNRSALIAGGGIGGLAAGLVLRRLGWTVRIHERAAAPRAVGFAVGLAPNAVNALRELGVTRTLDAIRPRPRAEICRPDGRVLRRFHSLGGGPLNAVLRGELHGELLDAVGRDVLVLDSNATNVAVSDGRATLELRSGLMETADLLIGADGIDSVIRRRLHPGEPPARPSGYCSVRGLAIGAAHRLDDLSGVLYFGDGVEAALAPAGHDSIYWYLSLLASNIPESIVDPLAAIRAPLDRFESRFTDVVAATTTDHMRFDVLLRRDPLEPWGTGPITLLGDAAHPVLPHTAQGAAQALEDAVALGLALARHNDVATALRRYEHVRFERTRTFIRLGPRIARMTTTRSRLVDGLRSAAIRWMPERLLANAGKRMKDPHRALRPSS